MRFTSPLSTIAQGMMQDPGIIQGLIQQHQAIQKQNILNNFLQPSIQTQAALNNAKLQMAQTQAKYAEPTIQAKNAYLNRIANAPKTQILKTANGYVNYNPMTGQSTPVTENGKQLLPFNPNTVSSGSSSYMAVPGKGLEVIPASNGNTNQNTASQVIPGQGIGVPNQQVGNQAQSPRVNVPLSGANAIAGQPMQQAAVRGPTSPPSKYAQWQTMVDPVSGDAFSTPTTSQATSIENTLYGENSAMAPLIDTISNLAPLAGGGINKLNRMVASGEMAHLGIDPDKLGANYSEAIKAIPGLVDKLAKSYQVTMGETNLKNTKDMLVKSAETQTPRVFLHTMSGVIASIINSSNIAKQQLKNGYDLQDNDPFKRQKAYSSLKNDIYNRLCLSAGKYIPISGTGGYTLQDFAKMALKYKKPTDDLIDGWRNKKKMQAYGQ